MVSSAASKDSSDNKAYKIAEITPLIQEIAVDVDAIGLGEVLGDELADGGQVFRFLVLVVLDVSQASVRVINCVLHHFRP